MSFVIKVKSAETRLSIPLREEIGGLCESVLEENGEIVFKPRSGSLIHVLRLLAKPEVEYVVQNFEEYKRNSGPVR